MSSHADTGLRSDLAVGRIQEMDKGRCHDDAGAEVAGEQVDIERDVYTGIPLGDDGEEGGHRGHEADYEDG